MSTFVLETSFCAPNTVTEEFGKDRVFQSRFQPLAFHDRVFSLLWKFALTKLTAEFCDFQDSSEK